MTYNGISQVFVKKTENLVFKQVLGFLNRLSSVNKTKISKLLFILYQREGRRHVLDALWSLLLNTTNSGFCLTEDNFVVNTEIITSFTLFTGTKLNFLGFFSMLAVIMDDDNLPCISITRNNIAKLLSRFYKFGILSKTLFHSFLVYLKEFKNIDLVTVSIVLNACGLDLIEDNPFALKKLVKNVLRESKRLTHLTPRIKLMMALAIDFKRVSIEKNKIYNNMNLIITTWNEFLTKANERINLNVVPEGKTLCSIKCMPFKSYYKTELKKSKFDFRFRNLDLIELATINKMNNIYRRRVFYQVVGSTDYLICVERLVFLTIVKQKQKKEITRILLYCCFQEIQYNPYYFYVVVCLTSFSRKHVKTLHFITWCLLKQAETKTIDKLIHVLTAIMKNRIFPLSVLKVLYYKNLADNYSLLFWRFCLSFFAKKYENN